MEFSPATIRKQLKRQREAISASDRARAEERVCAQLVALTEANSFTRIALYQAIKHELSLKLYINWLREQHISIYLPVIDKPVSGAMQFHRLANETNLIGGKFGLLEPEISPTSMLHPDKLQLVCVPMLGFCNNTRIGWGNGYYDRCFAFRKTSTIPPLLVGVAFALQNHPDIIPRRWDVDMDKIICG